MEKALRKIYYDTRNPSGFGTLRSLYEATKGKYPLEKIDEFLRMQDTYTTHYPALKKFPTRRLKLLGLHQQHFADLADISNRKRANDGYTFLLIVIVPLSGRFSQRCPDLLLFASHFVDVIAVFQQSA